MTLKKPLGVTRVVKVPSPAGQNVPAGGYHAYHTIYHDPLILKGTPQYAALEAFVREYAGSICQTEYATLSPDVGR